MSEYKNKTPAGALKHLYSADNNDSPTGDEIDEIWRRAAHDPEGRDEIRSLAEEDPGLVSNMLIGLLTVATILVAAINF